MAGSIPAASGRIFMSYRREETAYPAGWLYDRLSDHYGGAQVFKDVDSIELGDDFVDRITSAVGSCDVLLALVGDEWLTITDAHGQRRLDDPEDFVRLEIEAALTRNVRVIPILVDGARMPRADEVPASLAKLVRRQALELSPSRFDFDLSRLLKVLDRTLAEVQDDAASTREAAGTAPDRTTELPKASERREQTEPSPTPTIPPAAPAAPPGPSPSDLGRPPEGQGRGFFTRARVLAGAGVGVVLILVVVIIASSDNVIFKDDFSSRASGWPDVGSNLVGGHYTPDHRYRIRVEPGVDGGAGGGVPENAMDVFPSAPSRLAINVNAFPAGSPQDAEYGVACRIGVLIEGGWESYYAFVIRNGAVSIWKRFETDDLEEITRPNPLEPLGVELEDETNELSATCEGDDENNWVYLQLLVDGVVAIRYTDEQDVLPAGTVGLFAVTHGNASFEVEFDDFVVTG